jgi:hypothetical protein
MSADESFLARWARRKRGAAVTRRNQPKPKSKPDGAPPDSPAPRPPGEPQSHFDPASLPPIESIGARSDILPFLAAGVPAELTRAALRRAWSADPTIRDFIGLSENSWDFTAPGGVPGFGSLAAEDARRLLERIMDTADRPDSPRALAEGFHRVGLPVAESSRQANDPAPDQMKPVRGADAGQRDPMPSTEARNTEMQHERESPPPLRRRRHGGALPD